MVRQAPEFFSMYILMFSPHYSITDIIAFCWFENSARSLLAVPDFIACIRYFASAIFITQAYPRTKSQMLQYFNHLLQVCPKSFLHGDHKKGIIIIIIIRIRMVIIYNLAVFIFFVFPKPNRTQDPATATFFQNFPQFRQTFSEENCFHNIIFFSQLRHGVHGEDIWYGKRKKSTSMTFAYYSTHYSC